MRKLLTAVLLLTVLSASFLSCNDEFQNGEISIPTSDQTLQTGGDGDDGDDDNTPPPKLGDS